MDELRLFSAIGLSGLFCASALAQAEPDLAFESPRVICTLGPCTSGCDPVSGCSDVTPQGLSIGEVLSSDDYPEIVVCNRYDHSVSLIKNSGEWGANDLGVVFSKRYPILNFSGQQDNNAEPYDVEFADMDGDGDLDIVVSVDVSGCSGTDAVVILVNENGFFDTQAQKRIEINTRLAQGLTVADLNGDGRKDVSVGGQDVSCDTFVGPDVEILLQNQTPFTFTSQYIKVKDIFPTSSNGTATDAVAAVVRTPQTGGRLDLLMSLSYDNTLVMLNDGQTGATINWSMSLQSGRGAKSLVFGKLRSGTARDIAVPGLDSISGNAHLFVQQGDSTGSFSEFSSSWSLFELRDPFQSDIGKLTLDNQFDVATAMQHGKPTGGGAADDHGGVAICVGKPTSGYFYPTVRLFAVAPLNQNPASHPKPCFVKIADMNDDGRNDVITSNGEDGTISVLINSTILPNN